VNQAQTDAPALLQHLLEQIIGLKGTARDLDAWMLVKITRQYDEHAQYHRSIVS